MHPDSIRPARPADLARMVDLSEQKRREYQGYQPRFWRKAADSRERQLPFFERQLASDRVIALVCEQQGVITGFLIATLAEAPPVYDPGGLTCLVDDFVVAEPVLWASAGTALLAEASRQAKARGAVQTVVVCGHQDEPKRRMLVAAGHVIASEWYIQEIR